MLPGRGDSRAASPTSSGTATHNGPCEVTTISGRRADRAAVARYLDEYDILVRDNEAVPILREGAAAKSEPTLDASLSAGDTPFGFATNFTGQDQRSGLKTPVQVYLSNVGKRSRLRSSARDITTNAHLIDKWKVLVPKAVQGTSDGHVADIVLSKPIIAEPGTACTETYLVAGPSNSKSEAESVASYLRTRFVRFLVSLRKTTQHATRGVYRFVPDQPLEPRRGRTTTLYKKYGITKDEIAFIETA